MTVVLGDCPPVRCADAADERKNGRALVRARPFFMSSVFSSSATSDAVTTRYLPRMTSTRNGGSPAAISS